MPALYMAKNYWELHINLWRVIENKYQLALGNWGNVSREVTLHFNF